MRPAFLILSFAFLLTALPALSFGDDSDKKTTGRDVWGRPLGTDVQGNPNDKNVEGSRPKDVQGNPPHDIYGNEVGSEKKSPDKKSEDKTSDKR